MTGKTIRIDHSSDGLPPQGRQRYSRTAVYCEGRLKLSDVELACMILDISAGGAKIQTPLSLKEREAVVLCVGQTVAHNGMIVWQRAQHAGIAYMEDPELVRQHMPEIIRLAGSQEKRENLRVLVLWRAEMVAGAKTMPCQILDISPGGARVRASESGQVGREVNVHCDHFGDLAGEITWAKQGELGIQWREGSESILASLGL